MTHKIIKKGKAGGSLKDKIKVVIDSKTTVYVDDESKVEEVKKRYKNLENINMSRQKKYV